MSSDTYKPTTNLTPREIANPTSAAMPNQPIPASVAGVVQRQADGRLNSSRESGGYVGPGAFKQNR